jgi:hypothetical protein
MTEAEWLAATDPTPMLYFLRGSNLLSERKARLFAFACCLRHAHLADRPSVELLKLAERYAEGMATDEEVDRVPAPAHDTGVRYENAARLAAGRDIRRNVEYACEEVATVLGVAAYCANNHDDALGTHAMMAARAAEAAVQAHLLRDIFGNPFLPPPPLRAAVRAWNDGCLLKLANAVYDERDFSPGRMGILADALEEAGASYEEPLRHCREPGPVHVRGCWVIDWITGRQ